MNMVHKGITINMAEVDVDSYVSDAQPLLLQAINDPTSLNSRALREVARVIVSRSWEDRGYYSIAAKLCNFIAQKEADSESASSTPTVTFRNAISDTCNGVLEESDAMRKSSLQYWVNFVHFLAEAFRLLKFNGEHLRSISDILFKVLISLAKPPKVKNFDEVELLTAVLHETGSQLQEHDSVKMHQLVCALRDAFLDPYTSCETRVLLLPIIEKAAGHWKLSDSANQYYFDQ